MPTSGSFSAEGATRSLAEKQMGSMVMAPITDSITTVEVQPPSIARKEGITIITAMAAIIAQTRPIAFSVVRSCCTEVMVVTRPKMGTSQMVYAVSQRI